MSKIVLVSSGRKRQTQQNATEDERWLEGFIAKSGHAFRLKHETEAEFEAFLDSLRHAMAGEFS